MQPAGEITKAVQVKAVQAQAAAEDGDPGGPGFRAPVRRVWFGRAHQRGLREVTCEGGIEPGVKELLMRVVVTVLRDVGGPVYNRGFL